VEHHDQGPIRATAAGDIRLSTAVLAWSIVIAQLALALGMACASFRILRGPRAQDRVVGLDTLYVNAMLMLLTLGMRSGSTLYFEAALIIALLGFVGTVALAKFLLRGEVIE
jgi:multicomponent K+:H+ antiporter subunit F